MRKVGRYGNISRISNYVYAKIVGEFQRVIQVCIAMRQEIDGVLLYEIRQIALESPLVVNRTKFQSEFSRCSRKYSVPPHGGALVMTEEDIERIAWHVETLSIGSLQPRGLELASNELCLAQLATKQG